MPPGREIETLNSSLCPRFKFVNCGLGGMIISSSYSSTRCCRRFSNLGTKETNHQQQHLPVWNVVVAAAVAHALSSSSSSNGRGRQTKRGPFFIAACLLVLLHSIGSSSSPSSFQTSFFSSVAPRQLRYDVDELLHNTPRYHFRANNSAQSQER